MAEKDIAEKTLESYSDVFADIINVLLFQGNHILKAEELEIPVFGGQSSSAGRIIVLFQ